MLPPKGNKYCLVARVLVLGRGAAAAAGGGGGGGAAAAGGGGGGGVAAAAGAGAAAVAGLAPPGPSLSVSSLVPGWTVEPSSTWRASITPLPGLGTGTDVLSVSISQRTSSSDTESPTAFSHRMSPSEIESAKAGQTTTVTSRKTWLVYKLRLSTGGWKTRDELPGLLCTATCREVTWAKLDRCRTFRALLSC